MVESQGRLCAGCWRALTFLAATPAGAVTITQWDLANATGQSANIGLTAGNVTASSITASAAITAWASTAQDGFIAASGWAPGASPDPTRYYEWTVTADPGFSITYDSISLALFRGIQAGSHGAQLWDLRASTDAFASSDLFLQNFDITAAAADTQTLLKHADAAMYEARALGGGVHVYGAGTADPLERLELAARLRRAIERSELELHHQPILRLADEGVIGVESLVRWRDPMRGGLVPPGDFIPVAERTGVIEVANKYHPPTYLDEVFQEFELLTKLGHSAEFLDAEGMQAQVHSPIYTGGLWTKDNCAIVDPARLVWGLKAAAERLGVRIYEDTKATQLKRDGIGVIITTPGGSAAFVGKVLVGVIVPERAITTIVVLERR